MTAPRPIDPGAEFSKPRGEKLPWIIDFVKRNPFCTLPGGEAKLLVDEIDRLKTMLDDIDPIHRGLRA